MNFTVEYTSRAIEALLKNKNFVVISGGFCGDEAKGKITALLARYLGGFVRSNSGANAGHTVVINGKDVAFHLLPSGIASGKPSFIGNNCYMDPVSFTQEVDSLKSLTNDFELYIGNSFVVTPWHIILDALNGENKSTGRGISFIAQDVAAKRAPRLEDFINKNYTKLEESFSFWRTRLPNDYSAFLEKPNTPPHLKEIVRSDDFYGKSRDILSDYIEGLVSYIAPVQEKMDALLRAGEKLGLEGAQSFYLSNEVITYTSTTSANTHPLGTLSALVLALSQREVRTINVLKVPSSRVGEGANPSGYVKQNWFAEKELNKDKLNKLNLSFSHVYKRFIDSIDEDGRQNDATYIDDANNKVFMQNEPLSIREAFACASVLEYGEYGSTTGKPRVCGSLDLPHLAHLVKYQNRTVFLSRIDALDPLEKIPVVVGYIYHGDKALSQGKWYEKGETISIKDALPSENILEHAEPIYKVLPGWNSSSKTLKPGESLPEAFDKFLSYVQQETDCKIIGVGTGPKTDEVLFFKRPSEQYEPLAA